MVMPEAAVDENNSAVLRKDDIRPAINVSRIKPKANVNQRPKLSTCQRPKLSSLATFSNTAFMVFEAVRVIAGFQDVAMMRNAIQ